MTRGIASPLPYSQVMQSDLANRRSTFFPAHVDILEAVHLCHSDELFMGFAICWSRAKKLVDDSANRCLLQLYFHFKDYMSSGKPMLYLHIIFLVYVTEIFVCGCCIPRNPACRMRREWTLRRSWAAGDDDYRWELVRDLYDGRCYKTFLFFTSSNPQQYVLIALITA